jgi:cobalt-zinc-cadmium efflux system outer membrane protein
VTQRSFGWVVASCLAGCAPEPRSPSDAHADDRPAETVVLEREGRRIDPRTAGPMSLRQLWAYADVHAPALLVAKEKEGLGDAEVEGAERLLPHNPEVSVSAGGRTDASTTRLGLGAELEQRFEIAGQRGTRIEAAERVREAARGESDAVRWELRAEVRARYYEVLSRRAQLAAAESLVTFAEAIETVMAKRIKAGEESPLAALVAGAEIAQARQALILAKSALRTSELGLAETVGWPVTHPLRVKGALPEPRPALSVAVLTERALGRHPSRRWLELSVKAAEARVEAADRQAFPDPALAVSYSYEPEEAGTTHVWLGTLRLPLPLWERNQVERARTRAELGIARTESLVFEQRLRARIAAAVARVNAAAERSQIYGVDILPALKVNLEKLRHAFDMGEIDVLELSQIRGRLLATNSDALGAITDYYAALAELEALTGADASARR